MSKVRLLRQFSYGVIAYVVATALVVLLPIFVSSAPGEEAVRVVLVMQNIVLWVFMAGLAWIFRSAAPIVPPWEPCYPVVPCIGSFPQQKHTVTLAQRGTIRIRPAAADPTWCNAPAGAL